MTEPTTTVSILETFGVNGTLFVAQLLNFGVIVLVVWKFVYHPLIKLMDARDEKIAAGLALAAEAKQLQANAAHDHAKVMEDASLQARKLIEDARLEAEAERSRLKKETAEELDRQLAETRARLKADKEVMLAALKNEVATLVVEATAKVLRGVDPATQRVLIDQAIHDVKSQG